MNLLTMVQLAARIYVDHAYADNVPDISAQKLAELNRLSDRTALMNWDTLEHEGGRHALRLGNDFYPHMKLVFKIENGGPVFYVDAHDSHFRVSPEMAGYDKLVALRKKNKAIKRRIETAWSAKDLPIFGAITATFSTLSFEHVKVLTVDDEKQILDMMKVVATSVNAQHWSAGGVAEAKQLIQQRGVPDVIFCDVMMPEESGYELVRYLAGVHPNTPIYYITGMVLEQVDPAGVEDILQKPFSPKRIIEIIRNVAAA